MKCYKCGNEEKAILIKITDKNKSEVYCPNCIMTAVAEAEANRVLLNKPLWENNDEFVDDVTGKNGAIKYEGSDVSYYLELKTMLRLIDNSLEPDEYFALVEKYGADKFELHSDFYDECDGMALQSSGIIWDEDCCDERGREVIMEMLEAKTELNVLCSILTKLNISYSLDEDKKGKVLITLLQKNIFKEGEKIEISFDEKGSCIN